MPEEATPAQIIPPAAEDSPPASAAQILEADTPCLHCGYNLRGLTAGARWPLGRVSEACCEPPRAPPTGPAHFPAQGHRDE
jgi:hypothetical protein